MNLCITGIVHSSVSGLR